jgi:fructose-1,6-bisphosphatase/inositol monophosphatase family enzyme
VYSDFDKDSLLNFVTDVQQYKKVRLFGSAAMSLVHVAKGSVEVYKENNIALWDVAAGIAIVLAAGGKAQFATGKGPFYLNVHASNGQ